MRHTAFTHCSTDVAFTHRSTDVAVGHTTDRRKADATASRAMALPEVPRAWPVVRKPSRVKALTNPEAYQKRLQQYKAQRQQVLYQDLLRELSEPTHFNTKRIDRLLTKLIDWGKVWAIGRYMAVPPPEDRNDCVVQYHAVLRGIPIALDSPELDEQHKAVLTVLGKRIHQALARIDEVNNYEQKQAAASPRRPVDDDGAPWTRMDGSDEPVSIDGDDGFTALFDDPQKKTHWKFSDEGAGGAVLLSEELRDNEKRTRRPTFFTGKRGRSKSAFNAQRTDEKETRLTTVIKATKSGGHPEKFAQHLYGVLDTLLRRAPKAPAFGVGRHELLDLDASTRQRLAGRVDTAHARAERIEKRDDVRDAILGDSPVLLQEALAGTVVSDAPLWTRKTLWKDPDFCLAVGAALVQAGFTGLGDQLAFNGFGFNNWSNWVLPPPGSAGPKLLAIDLSHRPSGLDAGAVQGLQRLLKGIQKVARHLGPNGSLPANWRQLLEPSLGDFLHTTFTASDGLFTARDFMNHQEREEHAALQQDIDDMKARRQALFDQRPLDADNNARVDQLTRGVRALTGEQDRITHAAAQRGDRELKDILEAAMPHILLGLMQGLRWVVECGDALPAAHASASAGEAPLPGFDAENIHRIQALITKTFKPGDHIAMSRLGRPAAHAQPMQLIKA